MEIKYDILIVGAGSAGLMAARELSKQGKQVALIEARNRIGGRIFPLEANKYHYPAQGGAEWVHSAAPVTKELVREAGLTLVPQDGEMWSDREGRLAPQNSLVQDQSELTSKLQAITEDVSVYEFLEQYFPSDEVTRNSILRLVEGYDAADPKLMSVFTFREDLQGMAASHDHKIKEGYGALLSYLHDQCVQQEVTLQFNFRVAKIIHNYGSATAVSTTGETLEAAKVIITVPLPLINEILFIPEIQDKKDLTKLIGYGGAIKLVIRFKNRWWEDAHGVDASKMLFLFTNEIFLTWWTQYPDLDPILTGWIAGPATEQHKNTSSRELLDIGLQSLANAFKLEKALLEELVEQADCINWPCDPLAQGAYSYDTYLTKDAYAQFLEPVNDTVYFAGEALYLSPGRSTVEGALGSGQEVARLILTEEGK